MGKKAKIISMTMVLVFLSVLAYQPVLAKGELIATTDQLIVFKINDTNYYTQTIGSDAVNTVKMDTAPIIYLNRTFVPVRFLGNALGVSDSNIEWNSNTRTATLKGSKQLDLTIGKQAITVNGTSQSIDVAPMITNSRTMLPARFVAEGLGFKVDWDASNQLVIVYQGEKPDLSAILAKVKPVNKEEPKIEKPVNAQKIKDTPFYQLEKEQVQGCLNAPMPNYTSFGFDEMYKEDYEASYRYWNYVHVKLPYKFYTDKSLVYMADGDAMFRGYIDRGNGLQMVDLIFQDRGVSILDVNYPAGHPDRVIEKYYFDGREKIVY